MKTIDAGVKPQKLFPRCLEAGNFEIKVTSQGGLSSWLAISRGLWLAKAPGLGHEGEMGGGRKHHWKERLCEGGRNRSGDRLDVGSPVHVPRTRRRGM